ncbi:MAG: CehA/McbA family metallohydrolase [Acidimicrobiales bacterium]|nr:CehA/McbA family metallohydrolase [Acidimicrobiales bacterium]
MTRGRTTVGLVAVLCVAAMGRAGAEAPACAAAGDPVVLTGELPVSAAETYTLLPVDVAEGTTRVEVGYEWEDVEPGAGGDTRSVLDLGIWDADGTSGPEAFRGWSGSRQGLTARGQDPVFITAAEAERGYVPGPIEPGTWHVELGAGFIAPGGVAYEVTVTCTDADEGPPVVRDPVDPEAVIDDGDAWYAGDFHLHAFHSNPEGPAGQEMVDFARAAGLDFVPVTEYVTPAHWTELGATQRANPDVLLWPGREVITYGGHAIVLGETPGEIEYRVGHDGTTLGEIQRGTFADGALFGLAHPTIFPGEGGEELCRGCEFTLEDQIDLDRVDTYEVVNTGALLDGDFEPVGPGEGGFANPFVQTSVDEWESYLLAGHRITAVSGSDDKEGDHYGATATQVYAEQLSRPALIDAIEAGHAYVQARGVADSPTLVLTATAPDGTTAMFGDTLVADTAEVTLTVRNGDGQSLRVLRNGEEVDVVPIDDQVFDHTFTADRTADEGPLGTFWGIETFDAESLTTIANPVFLADRPARVTDRPAPARVAAGPSGIVEPAAEQPAEAGSSTWWIPVVVVAGVGVLVGAGLVVRRRRRERTS